MSVDKIKNSKLKGIIYLATNLVNGKKYVGQTIFTLEKRIKEHKKKSKIYKIGFPAAIRKYGINGFKWKIIEEVPRELLNRKEIFYIEKFKSHGKYGGYNLTKGGDNNFGSSGEFHFLAKMKPKDKEEWIKNHRNGSNNPNYGNGNAIKGSNHYLNKLSHKEREEWLDKNLRGKNNYQYKMSKKELKQKCHLNKLSNEEKEEWINKHLRGENNPFHKYAHLYSGKNSSLYGVKHDLAICSKTYVVTLPDGRKFLTKSITGFCDKFNKNNDYNIYKSGLYQCANEKIDNYRGFLCTHFKKKVDSDIPYYNGEKDKSKR